MFDITLHLLFLNFLIFLKFQFPIEIKVYLNPHKLVIEWSKAQIQPTKYFIMIV